MTQPPHPVPDNPPATSGTSAWPNWYRPLVWIALGVTLVAALLAFAGASVRTGLPFETGIVYLLLPGAIVASIAASLRFGPRWVFVAAALLDVLAVLIAARAAFGLAMAVILPFASLVLVLSVANARPRRLAFVAAWISSTTAMAVALTVGPVSEVTGLRNVGLAVAAGAVFVAFVQLHLVLLTELRARATDAARAEVVSRRLAEAELARTSRLLTAIVDASPVPTQAFTTDGTMVLWNPASERVFGWTSDEVVGRRGPSMVAPDEREAMDERQGRVLAGGTVHGERAHMVSRDGTDVWADVYAAPMVDHDGNMLGVAGQLVDVTEQIALEARLRRSARMDAIGQLSGGIAHDFNNMLTAIRGNAELLRDGLGPDQAALRDDVDEIIAAADRAGNLTRQLLAFARRAAIEPRVVDPAAVISEFAPMLGRLIGAHVRLDLDLAPDTGSVLADRGQLDQVILNLAINARDAMPDGGTLRIATANDGEPPGAVVLTVTDTGIGMDEHVRERIFEPFFTTKEQGKGTGMGLPTVYGIVSMFGGTIDVASEPFRGTTFTIRLPRVDAAAELEAPAGVPAAGPAGEDALPGGTETILLIEDEPAVRAFASRSLARLGYSVLEATEDAEAFAHARGHAGRIDLILSDVILPGTPGPALVRQLLALRPGTPTLLCSGFAPESSVGSEAIDPDRFLPKPYTQASLARAVRAAIDG